jgi:adenylate cyclase
MARAAYRVHVSEPAALTHLPPAVQPVRAVVWVLHLALPMAGLWLLLARPQVDLTWHHSVTHFWLVLAVAAVNVAIGVRMSAAALDRDDPRLFLVSLAFLASAGFFLVHALATPGVLLHHPNLGFDIAQPVGLTVAAVFAVASSLPGGGGPAVLRARLSLQVLLALLIGGWAVVSLLDMPPLNRTPGPRDVEGPLAVVAVVTVGLYLVAAVRYYLMHRRHPAAMLISIVTAFVLLAEAMVAVALAHKWQLSWWEWHALLMFAFGFVAYSAYVQYRREGSAAGLFDAITLDQTARAIRAEYGAALEELVAALQRGQTGPVAARLADRFGLTEGQAAVLERAGAALAAERDVSRRLGALVAVGERARVGLAEADLLRETLETVRPEYGDVRLALLSGGTLTVDGRTYDTRILGAGPIERDGRLAYPLTVKGRLAGVLEAPAVADRDAGRRLLDTLASQVSIALENARLYHELGTLFHQYLSPDVAAALLADPDQAALGGEVVEVTALFADLRGFTTFSEGVEPAEIVRMLNRYHGVSVPSILDNGGTVVQFVGDALLALFNAPARQPDHAVRAVRAALALQRAVDQIAASRIDWPRFRVGANTGPALVGNIGSEALRGFNAMGDAVNVAARLQALAQPVEVVIGETTLRAAGPTVRAEPLGDLEVKGRVQAVRAFRVLGIA